MAKILPLEALTIAFSVDISLFKATIKAASEEKGRIVAAKNAVIKRESSAIRG